MLFYLDIVDFFQSEVSQSEDHKHTPQGELCNGISVEIDVQIIQSPNCRESIYLNQRPDVGGTEGDGLQQTQSFTVKHCMTLIALIDR